MSLIEKCVEPAYGGAKRSGHGGVYGGAPALHPYSLIWAQIAQSSTLDGGKGVF